MNDDPFQCDLKFAGTLNSLFFYEEMPHTNIRLGKKVDNVPHFSGSLQDFLVSIKVAGKNAMWINFDLFCHSASNKRKFIRLWSLVIPKAMIIAVGEWPHVDTVLTSSSIGISWCHVLQLFVTYAATGYAWNEGMMSQPMVVELTTHLQARKKASQWSGPLLGALLP